ncbi:MAG: GNAT family N-acetyltransferase [Armatimonadota bacterium]|nr:GNAT family N-acetyltransferase [Armatimonadota bacterium]
MSQPLSADTRRRIHKHIINLGSPDKTVSEEAERRLIRFGPKAVEQVLGVAGSSDPQVRFRAVWILGKSRDERALPAILRLTDDPDGRVRYDAVMALGELGSPAAVPVLQQLKTRTGDPAEVSGAAHMALAKLGRSGMLEYRPVHIDDYEPVRQFLAEQGWQRRVQDAGRFAKMMERATRTVVVLEGSRVVGFGRALCDGVSNGYISMLAVAEDNREQGIGRAIVDRLMAGDEDDSVTWVLRAGRQSEGFWRKLGFSPSTVAMERTRKQE